MAKNRRPKDRSQKSKAPRGPRPEESSGGGLLSSMRGGIKSVAGQGSGGKPRKKTPAQQVWNVLFWVAIVAMASLFLYRRFR